MQLKDQSDHIALLSLMLVGTLTKRMTQAGQLDDETAHSPLIALRFGGDQKEFAWDSPGLLPSPW